MANAFQVVNDFEAAVAEFVGSRYAVAVDCCTNALFLCCRYLSVKQVTLPARTYCSVPAAVLHAGGSVRFRDYQWTGEYMLEPYPIVDSAGRLRMGMYRPQEFRCLCFHWTKVLPIGKGGMICHDDPAADAWFRLARFSGRHAVDQFEDPGFALAGWNCYLDPALAARGLALLKNLPVDASDCRSQASYPDVLRDNLVYSSKSDHVRYNLPDAYDVTRTWHAKGLRFRRMTGDDAQIVMSWRNDARSAGQFLTDGVITEDSHRRFVDGRPAGDLIWIAEDRDSLEPVGMGSLTVHHDGDVAELGRLLIAPDLRGRGYGARMISALWEHGLESLGLSRVWAEVLESNAVHLQWMLANGWRRRNVRQHPRGPVVLVQIGG